MTLETLSTTMTVSTHDGAVSRVRTHLDEVGHDRSSARRNAPSAERAIDTHEGVLERGEGAA